MPAHPAPTRRRSDGHVAGVGHQPPRQTGRDTAPRTPGGPPRRSAGTRVADQLAPVSHQQRRPARDLQVPDPLGSPVMDPTAPVAAMRARRTRHRRAHPHHQFPKRVSEHPGHPDLRQPQSHRNSLIRRRGPPGSASPNTDPSMASTPTRGPSTHHSLKKSRRANQFGGTEAAPRQSRSSRRVGEQGSPRARSFSCSTLQNARESCPLQTIACPSGPRQP